LNSPEVKTKADKKSVKDAEILQLEASFFDDLVNTIFSNYFLQIFVQTYLGRCLKSMKLCVGKVSHNDYHVDGMRAHL
jgi:hypothetical protein